MFVYFAVIYLRGLALPQWLCQAGGRLPRAGLLPGGALPEGRGPDLPQPAHAEPGLCGRSSPRLANV